MKTIFCWSLYRICYTDIFPLLGARRRRRIPLQGTCVEGLCSWYVRYLNTSYLRFYEELPSRLSAKYRAVYIMRNVNSRPRSARRLPADVRAADRMYVLCTCTSSLYVGVKTAMFIGIADKVCSPTLTLRCRVKCSGQTDVSKKTVLFTKRSTIRERTVYCII